MKSIQHYGTYMIITLQYTMGFSPTDTYSFTSSTTCVFMYNVTCTMHVYTCSHSNTHRTLSLELCLCMYSSLSMALRWTTPFNTVW